MKKIYLALIPLFLANSVKAQYDLNYIIDPLGWPVAYSNLGALDTISIQIEQTADLVNVGNWINVEKFASPKNAQGDPISLGIFNWDTTTNQWITTFNFDFTYTYNANNKVLSMTRTQDLPGYLARRFANYTIDGNGHYSVANYIDSLTYAGNDYYSIAKDTQIFNGSGELLSRTMHVSPFNSTTMEEDTRYTFTYTSGNVTEILEENWDGSAWENDARQTLTYDGNDNMLSKINEYWNGSAWTNEDKAEYTYDSEQRLSTTSEYIDTLGSWENDTRKTITYANSTGTTLDFYIEEIGNGSVWTNDMKFVATYTGAQVGFILGYPWDGSAFETTATMRYIYEDTTSTGGSIPNPPTDLEAIGSARTGSAITLTWTDNSSNEDGFTIERSLDGSSFTPVDDVVADVETYVDTNGLAASTQYFYRVVAFNANGSSSPSNTADVTTWTLAVNDLNESLFEFYPNPVESFLNINSTSSTKLSIYNVQGLLLNSLIIKAGSNTCDLSALESGVYLMSFELDDSREVVRVVKK